MQRRLAEDHPGKQGPPVGSEIQPGCPLSTLILTPLPPSRERVFSFFLAQLGLTFSNDEGELAPGVCTYQFNFKFSLADDIYAQDSIDLLTRSGIDFRRHEDCGIDVLYFAELLISSGCVLNDDVRWISFHSGYDFGYLMKLLTCKQLASDEDEFFSDLKLYFPQFYDIKYLMKACEGLKGGLNKLAEDLEVERIGPEHQAGSDSLLTQATFFKMRQLFFEGVMDDERHVNILYSLERGANLARGPSNAGGDVFVPKSSGGAPTMCPPPVPSSSSAPIVAGTSVVGASLVSPPARTGCACATASGGSEEL